ncbi:MAG: hypothetical protein F6J98_32775 [Moorea sp. SIO4G2]|nr:hypothetical protein [Moorena sp. SIO4G2]
MGKSASELVKSSNSPNLPTLPLIWFGGQIGIIPDEMIKFSKFAHPTATPDSRLPIPDSRFPTPDSRFPIP